MCVCVYVIGSIFNKTHGTVKRKEEEENRLSSVVAAAASKSSSQVKRVYNFLPDW